MVRMPRRKRRFVPGCAYHLISRFVDREWFISSESERAQYTYLLGGAVASSDWQCLGYAIMSNHIHLAMIAGGDKLDSWIRRAHAPFADWMNRTHQRIGNIFARGPKDLLIPDDDVARVLAYIHNNPVRAGVVNRAADSAWTSHRAYVGLERVPRWLDVREGLRRTGIGDATAFDAYVTTGPSHPLDKTGQDLDAIIADYEAEQIASLAPRRSPSVDPCVIVQIAAEEFAVPLHHLFSNRRGGVESLVRAVVARTCLTLGSSTVEVAQALRITPQAVSLIRARESHPSIGELCKRVLRRVAIVVEASYPQIL
jgi:putative transposase